MATIELGYLVGGATSASDRGVGWLKFVLRETDESSPNSSDVIVIIGRKSPSMSVEVLSFSYENSFIGFATGTLASQNVAVSSQPFDT